MSERPLPQALAAVDIALWDRAARKANCSVANLISHDAVETVAVNAVIHASDRAGAAKEAQAALQAGFACLKAKVAIGDDNGRLAAIRAAVGPDMKIRIDANGGWESPEEAIANLRALAPIGIELCEEPVHGLERIKAVRERSPIKIAIDESGTSLDGAALLTADSVCLKLSRSGGITPLVEQATAARTAGLDVFLTSTYDGPLGVAAGVHVAAALTASGPLLACGLSTLQHLKGCEDILSVRNGSVTVPTGVGLLGANAQTAAQRAEVTP